MLAGAGDGQKRDDEGRGFFVVEKKNKAFLPSRYSFLVVFLG